MQPFPEEFDSRCGFRPSFHRYPRACSPEWEVPHPHAVAPHPRTPDEHDPVSLFDQAVALQMPSLSRSLTRSAFARPSAVPASNCASVHRLSGIVDQIRYPSAILLGCAIQGTSSLHGIERTGRRSFNLTELTLILEHHRSRTALGLMMSSRNSLCALFTCLT